MKSINILYVVIFLAIGILSFSFANQSGEDYADEALTSDTSTEPFDKMMSVLMHKRCVNCHPAGDIPLQGEDSHLHNFDIKRGQKDHGLAGYQCGTCHQEENNDYSGVPGAPEWAVAPKEMAWEGKTRVEIATQMMDPARNGNRSHAEILKHLTEHKLVLWAWDPGVDAEGTPREKPPVPKDEYIAAVKEWIDAGAVIPVK